jgi:hypothetical protein
MSSDGGGSGGRRRIIASPIDEKPSRCRVSYTRELLFCESRHLQIIGNTANYGCLQRDTGTELSVFVSPMRFGSGSAALIVVLALTALLFFIAAVRRFRRRRPLSGAGHGAAGLVLLLLSVSVALLMLNLQTYRRLTVEQPAGELQLNRTGTRQFNAVLTYPTSERANFALRGDEWQVDARVLKWRAFANLIGFDAAYRLERISGRYSRVQDELTQARTVYSLNPLQHFDPWELVHRYHSWIPWTDALYGSATFLPMADGALYAISVSQSGLIARPLNQAARDAVGNWH